MGTVFRIDKPALLRKIRNAAPFYEYFFCNWLIPVMFGFKQILKNIVVDYNTRLQFCTIFYLLLRMTGADARFECSLTYIKYVDSNITRNF